MSKGIFLTPEEAQPRYPQIAQNYVEAYKGSPWNEVSLCPDSEPKGCLSSMSAVAVGSLCDQCGLCPTEAAYEVDKLVEKFVALGETKEAVWYIEEVEDKIALAALGWKASIKTIAKEKYSDVPKMKGWMSRKQNPWALRILSFGTSMLDQPDVVWLDEVFANKEVRTEGNLKNFGAMTVGMAERLGPELVMYRTIEPRMTAVAKRDYGASATVYEREQDVPDRRDFVVVGTLDRELLGIAPEIGWTSERVTRKKF